MGSPRNLDGAMMVRCVVYAVYGFAIEAFDRAVDRLS